MGPRLGVAFVLLVAACAAPRPLAPSPVAPPPVEVPAAATCAGTSTDKMAEVHAVLERRCFGCHASDGVAAEEHDFTRADELRAQRSSVADEVSARAMPPASRPPLSDAEVDLLVRWARCGARDEPRP